ncbi:hypothetical protein JHK85_044744 [Glycine max]|nr:hypothetical protein JHK86_044161 [Glycine max]KAG4950877.1 hypothetical protein JHK85_044744 [Glycine max]
MAALAQPAPECLHHPENVFILLYTTPKLLKCGDRVIREALHSNMWDGGSLHGMGDGGSGKEPPDGRGGDKQRVYSKISGLALRGDLTPLGSKQHIS